MTNSNNSGWNGYYTWSVITADDKNQHVGSFSSRKMAVNYLNKMKEEYFFECGNMDEAERVWGLDNFKFEQTFTLSRKTIMYHFSEVDLNKWNFEI